MSRYVLSRFLRFFCHEFINVYTLWFIFWWHWWWWWWWWARWRLWCFFLPKDIPNILLFSSMAVDLTDLATRDGIPFARSIFDVYSYILLLDPCFNARNWSSRCSRRILIHGARRERGTRGGTRRRGEGKGAERPQRYYCLYKHRSVLHKHNILHFFFRPSPPPPRTSRPL